MKSIKNFTIQLTPSHQEVAIKIEGLDEFNLLDYSNYVSVIKASDQIIVTIKEILNYKYTELLKLESLSDSTYITITVNYLPYEPLPANQNPRCR